MSGDDVKGNEQPDAQQMMPTRARTARPASGNGSGIGAGPEVSWVGEQHRMGGYCGRAVPAVGAEGYAAGIGAAIASAASAASAASPPRRVGLLGRPRGLVVRIGPRACAEDAVGAATAA